MLFKYTVNNFKEDLKMLCIKYAYIVAPIIGLIIYTFFLKNKCPFDTEFKSNLINVSGVLAGFLFTSLGIIISLPDNKFTNLLKQTRYISIIYNSMIIGIIALLISMLFGMFSVIDKITITAFIIGISETFLSAYYLYRVSYYSGKSK